MGVLPFLFASLAFVKLWSKPWGLNYVCTVLGETRLWATFKNRCDLAIVSCLLIFFAFIFLPKSAGYWEYFSLLLILLSCALLRYTVSKPGFREGPTFRLLVICLLFFDLNALQLDGNK